MSLTGATAVITLTIPGVFSSPQQLQGFAADEVFDGDAIQSVETLMGVDGVLSGGFVYVEVPQTFTLQADSPSNAIFDAWWGAMQNLQDVIAATGTLSLKTISTKWAMTNGFLKSYKPVPDVKKLVQPRKFQIVWNSVSPAAVS